MAGDGEHQLVEFIVCMLRSETCIQCTYNLPLMSAGHNFRPNAIRSLINGYAKR